MRNRFALPNGLAAAAIVAAGVAVYANSFRGPFVFDDLASIPDNPSIRQLWPLGPALAPPAGAGVGGRPLLNLSFALNYAVGGIGVGGYHAFNLLIHLAAALILFGIARRTLRDRPDANGIACAAALLWAIHSLQTASVTYLSQRAESLMGLCYLLTLYGLIRAAAVARAWPWLALAVVSCWAGMAVKEVMMTAPVLLLLYDRTFLAGSFRAAWRQRRWFYGALAGGWLMLALLLKGLGQRGVGFVHGVSGARYAATESEVILRYLGLAIWPRPLVLDYGTWFASDPLFYLPCAAIVLGLLAASLVALWRRPALGFLGCAFFLLLAPTSSVFPVAAQPMAENRMYLPLAALLVLVVVGCFERAGGKAWIGVLLIGGFWGIFTFQRNGDYRTELGLWQITVDQRPENPRAHYEFGNALLKAGRPQDAIIHYAEASRLSPEWPAALTAEAEAEYDEGNVLGQSGQTAAAIASYQAAIKIRPEFAEAQLNLGAAELAAGHAADAVVHLRSAVRLRPENEDAKYDLALALKALAAEPAR